MKKLRPKKLTTFLVVLFTVAVLVCSHMHYSEALATTSDCEGAAIDCSRICIQNDCELRQVTVAMDQTCLPYTRKATTGGCGDYFLYTHMVQHGTIPVCDEYLCESSYSRTSGNCIVIHE